MDFAEDMGNYQGIYRTNYLDGERISQISNRKKNE